MRILCMAKEFGFSRSRVFFVNKGVMNLIILIGTRDIYVYIHVHVHRKKL